MIMTSIVMASVDNIEELVPLFDMYRVFYKQSSDPKAAEQFLRTRFDNEECTVFIARIDDKSVGFTLLYTSFSSVSLQPTFILNDLFVSPEYRGEGVGESLLTKAKEYCREMNYKGLTLETAIDNPAQKLYEKLNWKRDTHCFHYFWSAV